jgi:hypothetical protein
MLWKSFRQMSPYPLFYQNNIDTIKKGTVGYKILDTMIVSKTENIEV